MDTQEVRLAAIFLAQMIDLLRADSGKLQRRFRDVFEGLVEYPAQFRKHISHGGCLYYYGQAHDPGNTLYTMALELLLPGFRRSFPWGEEKLGDLVEGLLWVWSPEFMASEDLQQEADQTRRQHYMNIQWLLQCAEPPVSQDLTMIGFLHGWFSSVFMLSRATGYTQPFSNVEELLTFRDWTPQNSCPNKKMRAQLEAMALKLDQILMQESESEESLDPYHCKGDEDVEDEDPEEDKVPEDEDLEDEDEDEALAMSDDEPMYRHELCDETSDEENEYLNMLLEQSSESEDEHDPA